MSDDGRIRIASEIHPPDSLYEAIDILKRRLIGIEVSLELHTSIANAKSSLARGAIDATSLVVVLSGFKNYCSDEELCRTTAREVARLILPVKVLTVTAQLVARFESRNEKQRPVVLRLCKLAQDNGNNPEPLVQPALRSSLRQLSSLVRTEVQCERDMAIRQKLAIHADQLEVILSLLY